MQTSFFWVISCGLLAHIAAQPHSEASLVNTNILGLQRLCQQSRIVWTSFQRPGRRAEYIDALVNLPVDPNANNANNDPRANINDANHGLVYVPAIPAAVDIIDMGAERDEEQQAQDPDPPGVGDRDEGGDESDTDGGVILQFFREIRLEEYGQIFVDNGYFSLLDLEEVTEADIRALGIARQGHVKRILRKLKERIKGRGSGAAAPHRPPVHQQPPIFSPAPPPPAQQPVSAALKLEFEGVAINAILTKGGRKASETRSKVVTATNKVRFLRILNAQNSQGVKVNAGGALTKRCIYKLYNAGLVRILNEFHPNRAGRQGRGGPRHWNCEIERNRISIEYRNRDVAEKQELKDFLAKYKQWVHWPSYALWCGDARECAELGLYPEDDDDDDGDEDDDSKQEII